MKKTLIYIGLCVFVLGACTLKKEDIVDDKEKKIEQSKASSLKEEIATFAGGCFWCVEAVFEELKGVNSVISGYAGGNKKNPTYKEVSSGQTEHLEVIQIHFNPQKISYKQLVEILWKNINPTDDGGQFVDRGTQYSTAIFYHNEEEKRVAEHSKQELQNSGRYEKPIITPIRVYKNFFSAEEYHQDYYKKNSVKYKLYRYNSGRDQYLKKKWGKDKS